MLTALQTQRPLSVRFDSNLTLAFVLYSPWCSFAENIGEALGFFLDFLAAEDLTLGFLIEDLDFDFLVEDLDFGFSIEDLDFGFLVAVVGLSVEDLDFGFLAEIDFLGCLSILTQRSVFLLSKFLYTYQ